MYVSSVNSIYIFCSISVGVDCWGRSMLTPPAVSSVRKKTVANPGGHMSGHVLE